MLFQIIDDIADIFRYIYSYMDSYYSPRLVLNQDPAKNKTVILDCSGGSGKTTLARKLEKIYGFLVLENDDMKYGENWKRYSPEEYSENIRIVMKTYEGIKTNSWIISGTYHDERLPAQKEEMDRLIAAADTVILYDMPRLVVCYRKLMRSFWRAVSFIMRRKLGLSQFPEIVPQGTATETPTSVYYMTKKSYSMYPERKPYLIKKYEELLKKHINDDTKQIVYVKWPHNIKEV